MYFEIGNAYTEIACELSKLDVKKKDMYDIKALYNDAMRGIKTNLHTIKTENSEEFENLKKTRTFNLLIILTQFKVEPKVYSGGEVIYTGSNLDNLKRSYTDGRPVDVLEKILKQCREEILSEIKMRSTNFWDLYSNNLEYRSIIIESCTKVYNKIKFGIPVTPNGFDNLLETLKQEINTIESIGRKHNIGKAEHDFILDIYLKLSNYTIMERSIDGTKYTFLVSHDMKHTIGAVPKLKFLKGNYLASLTVHIMNTKDLNNRLKEKAKFINTKLEEFEIECKQNNVAKHHLN